MLSLCLSLGGSKGAANQRGVNVESITGGLGTKGME